MKQLIFSFILLCLFSPLTFAANFNTGDKQIDRWLVNIDYVARKDQMQAVKELAKQFKVSEKKIMRSRMNLELSVADLYAVLAIEKATGDDWDKIIESFIQYRRQGLDEILKLAGMPPHSNEFKQFKALIQQGAPKEDLEADSRNIFKKKSKP
ncbi:hypothetical protein [Pleionea mediterranea]|uniref:Uncharacterized protein n=1 Tax=Pleionea mediterranea TaxID=523701 RepID=A0A316G1G8_9GAMM|nr:hypothetical protein [Pleionea mediterranea]PWK53746.1 hypothetical protein C8D97_102135 [Pleionea mediterranea]